MSTGAASDDNVSVMDFFFSGEFGLDAPIDEVWPVVLDYTTWQDFRTAENVSGKPGEPGEIVRLLKVTEDFETPLYLARTIVLEPGRIVWKVYPETSGDGNEFLGAVGFSGYVDFQVRENGPSAVVFTYNAVYESLVEYEQESELTDFEKKTYEEYGAMFDAMWVRLRKLVEKD
jgi:hypothetical protein